MTIATGTDAFPITTAALVTAAVQAMAAALVRATPLTNPDPLGALKVLAKDRTEAILHVPTAVQVNLAALAVVLVKGRKEGRQLAPLRVKMVLVNAVIGAAN
jgi:hypothetical protein